MEARRVTALATAVVKAGDDAIRAVQDLQVSHTQNSARVLHNRFGLKDLQSRMYRATVPLVGSDGVRRLAEKYPICLPHELLSTSYDRRTFLSHVTDPTQQVPSLPTHPVTTANPLGVAGTVPLGLFVDAAGFTKTDSFLAWMGGCVHVEDRIVFAVLRKAEYCQCGCRGRCSIAAIEEVLAWSFRALAQGFWPTERHDGQPWGVDVARSARAGLPLFEPGIRGALVEYRGDLLQFVEGVGIQSYANKHAPCYCCKATKAQLHEAHEFDPRTPLEYEMAAFHCTKELTVTPPEWDTIRTHLGRSQIWRGTAILRPRPVTEGWAEILRLGLRHGDLLLRSKDTPDPFSAPTQSTESPLVLKFWRRNKRGPVQFVSPLAAIPGWTLPGIIRLDCLHVVDLGVCRDPICHFKHVFLTRPACG